MMRDQSYSVWERTRRHISDEIWTIGVVPQSADDILRRGIVSSPRWIEPVRPGTILADPAYRARPDGGCTLYAEFLDYREGIGEIWSAVIEAGGDLADAEFKPLLRLPYHASYPFPIEVDGSEALLTLETWQAGSASLWQERRDGLQSRGVLLDGMDVVDPTLWKEGDRWWLFCTLRNVDPDGALFLFHAPCLGGPWTGHAGNPVKVGRDASRPAGPLFRSGGMLVRPAQDCQRTYGGGVTLFKISVLDPDTYREEPICRLDPVPGEYSAGLHTFCPAGASTLIDGKRWSGPVSGISHRVQRRLRKLGGMPFRRRPAAAITVQPDSDERCPMPGSNSVAVPHVAAEGPPARDALPDGGRPAGPPDLRQQPVICMLCPGPLGHAGGIGRWAGYLNDAWPRGTDVPPFEVVDTRGVGGVWSGAVVFGLALLRIARLRASGRLGLLHLNLSVRGSTARKWIVSVLAHWTGVPTVVNLHSGRFPSFYAALPGFAKAAVRRMFARSARVVVLGQVWRDFVIAELRVPPDRIDVIPSAVAGPTTVPVHPPRETCHIIMLGRLGAPKGLPELMQALASTVMRDLPWRMTLAGDGDSQPFQKQAIEAGIADKVRFAGWLEASEVAALLADADILVLPSRSENLPVAVIEAMANSVAVVTTPVGATADVVQDGVSALFVPVGDPAALALAIARLVTDPVLRRQIADAGHRVFRARLDVGQSVKRWLDLYMDIFNRSMDEDGRRR